MYAAEKLHVVEVGADQKDHLVGWLSKRVGTPLVAPDLTAEGFSLVGGRLLPASGKPAAQFMYQDRSGTRISLYVTRDAVNEETGFRLYEEDGPPRLLLARRRFLLCGGRCRAAKIPLLSIANAAYRQLLEGIASWKPSPARRSPPQFGPNREGARFGARAEAGFRLRRCRSRSPPRMPADIRLASHGRCRRPDVHRGRRLRRRPTFPSLLPSSDTLVERRGPGGRRRRRGFVGYCGRAVPQAGRPPARLYSIAMAPGERGRGNGRSLLAAAEAAASARHAASLRLEVRSDNDRARAPLRAVTATAASAACPATTHRRRRRGALREGPLRAARRTPDARPQAHVWKAR